MPSTTLYLVQHGEADEADGSADRQGVLQSLAVSEPPGPRSPAPPLSLRRSARKGRRSVLGVSADQRLAELGLQLPQPFPPAGSYVAAVRTGALLYLSGAGPVRADGSIVTGKVGETVDLETAVEAARLTALQLLAVMRHELGSLDKVRRIVKTLGMVNCAPGFNRTPQVIDGCSDLLIEVFGDTGRGARSAVGMAELPFDISVEIELIVETTD
ncbi:MAG: RidA family protein [Ilumatobacteraceae bacterium]